MQTREDQEGVGSWGQSYLVVGRQAEAIAMAGKGIRSDSETGMRSGRLDDKGMTGQRAEGTGRQAEGTGRRAEGLDDELDN